MKIESLSLTPSILNQASSFPKTNLRNSVFSANSADFLNSSNQIFQMEYVSVTYKFEALKITMVSSSSSRIDTSAEEVHLPKWQELKKESDRLYALFVQYLEDLLGKQIEKNQELKIKKFKQLKLKAQEAISENGYWGAKAVSQRILDFAKSISNGDPSKIDILRNAVEKAFSEVKEKLGGWLPEVSQRTYELVMKGFDEWKKTAQGLVQQGDVPETENAEAAA